MFVSQNIDTSQNCALSNLYSISIILYAFYSMLLSSDKTLNVKRPIKIHRFDVGT